MEVRVRLLQEIFGDIKTFKWSVFLAVFVLINALFVVIVTNETRLLSIDHNRLLAEHDRLEVEWRHLLLEQSSLSEHSRVRELAQDKLSMRRPLATDETLVEIK